MLPLPVACPKRRSSLVAFLALSVIPSLKITDRGLVDVDRFELEADEAAAAAAPERFRA